VADDSKAQLQGVMRVRVEGLSKSPNSQLGTIQREEEAASCVWFSIKTARCSV